MGEWSDYFEDFPDEDPANDLEAIREGERQKRLNEVAQQSAELRATIARLAEEGRLRGLAKAKQATEDKE